MKNDIILKVIKIINIVLLSLPFTLVWYLYYSYRIVSPFYRKGNWVVIALFISIYVIYGRVYDGFLVSINRVSDLVYSQVLSLVIANFILYIVISLLSNGFVNPAALLCSFALQFAISALWSYLSNKWYFSVHPPKKTYIIYSGLTKIEKLIKNYGYSKKFNVVKTLNIEEYVSDNDVIKNAEAVFTENIQSHDRNNILKYCIRNGITVYTVPRVGDELMEGALRMHLFNLPVLEVRGYSPKPEYLFIKRIFDLVISVILTVILSPLMLITALMVKKDGGPAIYKQKRLTTNGKEFYIYKFRSMIVNAEKDGIARLSTGENDSRITKVGKVLRKYRIDELPQLFNIIKGDLSLVGPRPERPEIALQYEKDIPEFRLRLQAKAGLTGYAQVYGKYNTSPYDKLLLDLMYISQPSLIEDLRIMFATIKILFIRDSTEGIEEGKTTA